MRIEALGVLSRSLTGWTRGVQRPHPFSMDVVAEWFSAAHMRGTIFSRTELSSPFGLEFPAAPRVAFHVMVRGTAVLLHGRSKPLQLEQGDVVVLTSGSAHRVASSPQVPVVQLMDHLQHHPLGVDRTIRLGGGGAGTVLLCGAYNLDQHSARPLMGVLPPWSISLPTPRPMAPCRPRCSCSSRSSHHRMWARRPWWGA